MLRNPYLLDHVLLPTMTVLLAIVKIDSADFAQAVVQAPAVAVRSGRHQAAGAIVVGCFEHHSESLASVVCSVQDRRKVHSAVAEWTAPCSVRDHRRGY